MRHRVASWEKEYTFQPNIMAAKDDWRAPVKPTYMYPPRPTTSQRNDAKFVQQSTLGMASHRHPVGLPKHEDGTTSPLRGAVRPRSSASLVGGTAPSARTNVYDVTKSDYRPSTTASGGKASASGAAAGRGGASRTAARAASRGTRVDDRATTPYYTVVPDDPRGAAPPREGSGHHQREYSTHPEESRERMYAETVRNRRNEHLRSGDVEPEWERQRAVMDLVGAKSADRLLEEGYDSRYRQPGGMLDVRRSRPVMSARDRTAMAHQLFPENYRNGVPSSAVTSSSGGVGGGVGAAAQRHHRGRGSSRAADGTEEVDPPTDPNPYSILKGMDDDRHAADGEMGYPSRIVPPNLLRAYVPRDDRMEHTATAYFSRASGAQGPLPEVDTAAEHRAGMYNMPLGHESITERFDAIASKYAAANREANTSFYPHPQGRRLGPAEVYLGSDISVFHGANGPMLVSEVHSSPAAGALGGGSAYGGAEPVLSPPRGMGMYRQGGSRLSPRRETSVVYGLPTYGVDLNASLLHMRSHLHASMLPEGQPYGYTPNLLDRTPPPHGYGYHASRSAANVTRVFPGAADPIAVEDMTPTPTPRGFQDDRDVFVEDGARGNYVRLSPEQVRAASAALDGYRSTTADLSFANPLWNRRLSGNATPQPNTHLAY